MENHDKNKNNMNNTGSGSSKKTLLDILENKYVFFIFISTFILLVYTGTYINNVQFRESQYSQIVLLAIGVCIYSRLYWLVFQLLSDHIKDHILYYGSDTHTTRAVIKLRKKGTFRTSLHEQLLRDSIKRERSRIWYLTYMIAGLIITYLLCCGLYYYRDNLASGENVIYVGLLISVLLGVALLKTFLFGIEMRPFVSASKEIDKIKKKDYFVSEASVLQKTFVWYKNVGHCYQLDLSNNDSILVRNRIAEDMQEGDELYVVSVDCGRENKIRKPIAVYPRKCFLYEERRIVDRLLSSQEEDHFKEQ